QVRPALLGHVEAQLIALEPDRVEARLLAEDDPALGADERGRERLDRLRDVELAGDGAALAHEQVLADDGLPGLDGRPGRLANEGRDGTQPVEPELRLDAVQRGQRQRNLAEVRVPGPLAHAVDRAV